MKMDLFEYEKIKKKLEAHINLPLVFKNIQICDVATQNKININNTI